VTCLRIILLLAISLTWCGAGHATTVAILRPSSNSPEIKEAVFRLQGELLAVGLEVARALDPSAAGAESDERKAWLERIVSERRLDAVIAVVGDPKPVAVDVWIVERSTQSLRLSRVVLEPNVRNASATLAIRAIEVLRSNFFFAALPEKTPPDGRPAEAGPREVALPPAPQRNDHFGVEAGAALLTSLDGVGPAILALARFDLTLYSGFVGQATLAGLGTRPTVETEAGGVRIAQHYGLLGLCYCPASESRIRPVFSLAAGVVRTSLDGSAEAPNRGHRIDHWAFLLDGSIGARLDLSRPYYLGLAAHVQLAEPYVGVHFVDELVATTGNPNFLMSLTVGAQL
jgi:hypothetical protein